MRPENSQQEDVELNLEDQENINAFSRLARELEEVMVDLNSHQEEMDLMDDIEAEVLMDDESLNEDGKYNVRLGDAYIELDEEEFNEELEGEQQIVESRLGELVQRRDEIRSEQAVLKKLLYAKFGDSIALDSN